MMNPYTIELLARERQRELDEDIKRIQLARTVPNPSPGVLKKFVLGLWAILFPMQSRMQNRYRPIIEPALSAHDSPSTKKQSCFL